MRIFQCSICGNRTFFTNFDCIHCGTKLGFDPETMSMKALEAIDPADFSKGYTESGDTGYSAPRYYCSNASQDACNWLVPANSTAALCLACALNRTVPSVSNAAAKTRWQELERAKKRLVYSLLRFGLPLDASDIGKDKLNFDFVEDTPTGHLDGTITINLAEADSVERERQKQLFDEPYRTLLGHLRHESGHFYWRVLVEASPNLEAFRRLFGDESADYGEALKRHHQSGPAPDWQACHVSAYASAHPWEDWAESWAHYIHMVDAVETAEFEGIEPRASNLAFGEAWPYRHDDVYRGISFETLKQRWVPLTIALNALNRSMGHGDFYPFVTPEPAYAKLAFIHDLVRSWGARFGG